MIRETDVGEMRMIRVRTAGSRTFCEAYLVLRPRAKLEPIRDIVAEAEKIISECASPAKVSVACRRHIGVFFVGVFAGIAATAAATAIALFCLCR